MARILSEMAGSANSEAAHGPPAADTRGASIAAQQIPANRWSKRKLLLALVVLLMAGAFAFWHVSSWPTRLRYPGEQNFVEGMRLVEMAHLRQGVGIYAPPSPEGFDAAIYGPLYYLLGARLIDPSAPAYWPLRLLSLLATLGCAAGCALLAFWVARSFFAAALAPLIFLSYGFVSAHGLSARSDMVALLLFFSGFLVAYRFRRSGAVLAAAPLMALGVYYKQQFVAGPLAVFLFLLLEKRYKHAAQFVGLMALLGAMGLGILEGLLFPGQEFLHHFVSYNLLPYSFSQLSLGLFHLGLMFLVPLLLGLEFLRVQPDKLLGCYLASAVVLDLLSVGKSGSDSNYFLECALLLSVLVASLVTRNLSGPMSAAEIVALLGITLFFAQWFTRAAPQAEDFRRDQAVQTYLRGNFAPHALTLGTYPGDLIRAGLDTNVSDLFQYSQLVRNHSLPGGDLLAQLRQRRFAAIVIHFDLREKALRRPDRLPSSWTQAILANYRLAATFDMPAPEKFLPEDRLFVWVPSP